MRLGRTNVGERGVPADFESEEESCERERRDGRPRCRQQREGVRQRMLTGRPAIEMLMMPMLHVITFMTTEYHNLWHTSKTIPLVIFPRFLM